MTNILPAYERRCIYITEISDLLQIQAQERSQVIAHLIKTYPKFNGDIREAQLWLDNMETRADGGMNNNASKILDQIWAEALSVEK